VKGQALRPDRLLDPSWRPVARELYESVGDPPLVCPHGHVDPSPLADLGATLGTPAELFIIPDHHVYRMHYRQGIAMEDLGTTRRCADVSAWTRARTYQWPLTGRVGFVPS